MVTAPRLVELIAELDAYDRRDDSAHDQNRT